MDIELTSTRDWDFSDPAFSDFESDELAALKAFMVQEILAIWPTNIPKPYAIEIDFVIDEDRDLEFIYLERKNHGILLKLNLILLLKQWLFKSNGIKNKFDCVIEWT